MACATSRASAEPPPTVPSAAPAGDFLACFALRTHTHSHMHADTQTRARAKGGVCDPVPPGRALPDNFAGRGDGSVNGRVEFHEPHALRGECPCPASSALPRPAPRRRGGHSASPSRERKIRKMENVFQFPIFRDNGAAGDDGLLLSSLSLSLEQLSAADEIFTCRGEEPDRSKKMQHQ